MISFTLNMARRETRAAWRHFLYFFICIALGVGALVGVGVFAANVEGTVTREARALMGGDVEIRLSHPLSEAGESWLKRLAARGIETAHVSELVAMATRPDGADRLVVDGSSRPTQIIELKAVESAYPFYGALNTIPQRPLRDLLAPSPEACRPLERSHERGAGKATICHGAVVQEALLIKIGLSIGERLKIGQATFVITGILRHEPDRVASAFSLGPRVMISQQGLKAAELIQPGSRVRERYLLRLPSAMSLSPLVSELRGVFADEPARISTYRDAQPQLRHFLDQLTRYLGLIGLTALFVGGIGVAGTVHAFLKEKIRTIAVLKTLGADSGMIVRTYLAQTLSLGLLGSFAGVVLGLSLQGLVPRLLAALVPAHVLELATAQNALPVFPILKGILVGLATTLLFTLWPLLGIREVRPASVFRNEAILEGRTMGGRPFLWRRLLEDRLRVFTASVMVFGLSGLAVWQAGSFTVGALFIGALAGAVIVLQVAARLLIHILMSAPSPPSIAFRHAMGNLHRSGSQATGIMVSVGIGVMIIVTVSLLEHALVRQIGESRPVDAPTFFFIDIQPDQKDAFQRLIQNRLEGVRPEMTPLVRSRLHAVNGRVIEHMGEMERDQERERGGEPRRSWYFNREYVLTFLDRIPKDNTIVKGEWWMHGLTPDVPLVSVEEEAARHLGLDLGSVVEFDIQGATVAAMVGSLRKVEWNNFSTNFYMILSPGSLEGAPFTYVATVRVKPKDEVPLQQAVVEAFPNVTAINIGEVMETFSRVLQHLSFAIRTVALFCILAGAIVMAAALTTSRYQRLYESVVLKALGATRHLIAGSFAAEYALIGSVAGLIGILLASALSWGVMYFFFDLPWTLQPKVLIAGLGATIILTLSVGFLTTFRILGERPLTILRQE